MNIDHVEIYVSDRQQAAEWYQRVLGFEPVQQFAHWADSGPLMMSASEGQGMIALFKGPAQEDQPIRGFRRMALRTTAAGFIEFMQSSSRWSDPPLGANQVQDHQQSISVYFADPFGNPLEVTTYDTAAPRAFVLSMKKE